jgi:uncharacterized protein YndB with AHSA1/START domain
MTTPETRITALPGSLAIEVTRRFAAPPELLLRAHTEADLLAQWLGPGDKSMTIERFEPRHGGGYRYAHRDDDGSEYWFRGVYHGDPTREGMIFTFEWEGLPGHVAMETVRFEEQEGGTLLRQLAVFQSVEDRDGMMASGMERGVNDSMEKLAALLARLQAGG